MPVGTAHEPPPVRRIALLGNYPPRLCGIATFTADVRAALTAAFPRAEVGVWAMDDGGAGDRWPREVVGLVPQDDATAYARAAEQIERSGAEVLCVQHEYGIFGGPAGDKLLRLVGHVSRPLVVTLHTVLEAPTDDQRRVLDALAARAAALIVMAEKGRDILERVHPAARGKVEVIPHGIPDRTLVDAAAIKPRFGWDGRAIILSFGLLGPGKGLETVIRALPGIAEASPDVLYVILGATHPHLVAREGEAYRERLGALARDLGVEAHLQFIDRFVETPELLQYLAACDVYVTPYLNEAQITSGTLSYAVGLGRPVVSTPYWHAAELLADGVGVLCPFGDADCFAREIGGLLRDESRRRALGQRAWDKGRAMIWPRLAEAYMAVFARVVRSGARPPVPGRPNPRLDALLRMTDEVGLLQHARRRVPDRAHGYCLDDNARALGLIHRLPAAPAELAVRYAAFVQHAWNGPARRFRNFMGYDRAWREDAGSDDSNGRALHALAVTAAEARDSELAAWALDLFAEAAEPVSALTSPRAQAWCALAGAALLEARPGHGLATRLAEGGARALLHHLAAHRRPDWTWFEPALAYDNARFSEACLRAGVALGRQDLVDAGTETLAWLSRAQTGAGGLFRAVGTDSIGQPYAGPMPFDGQALEAWASVDAAEAAARATGDARWREEARRAHAWFTGANEGAVPLATDDGGCCDALTPGGVNPNVGGESILAWLGAQLGLARLESGDTARETAAALG